MFIIVYHQRIVKNILIYFSCNHSMRLVYIAVVFVRIQSFVITETESFLFYIIKKLLVMMKWMRIWRKRRRWKKMFNWSGLRSIFLGSKRANDGSHFGMLSNACEIDLFGYHAQKQFKKNKKQIEFMNERISRTYIEKGKGKWF